MAFSSLDKSLNKKPSFQFSVIRDAMTVMWCRCNVLGAIEIIKKDMGKIGREKIH